MSENTQIKTKQRVSDHGEVFTSEREVNAMLDLVRHETECIDSRFLEPACGTGNFLIEVLRRKIKVVTAYYKSSQTEYEKYSVVTIGSLYGIDLLEDNVTECRDRLYSEYELCYRKLFKTTTSELFLENIKFVLRRNIVCGNALTMKDSNGELIIFSEWSSVTSVSIKRRDFSFGELIKSSKDKQASLFDAGWTSEKKKAEFVPNPTKEYPIRSYKELISDG